MKRSHNKIPYNAMKLNQSGIKTPVNLSLLKETSNNVVLSTLKKAEKEERLVLRFFIPTETAIAKINTENNHFTLKVKRNQVKTVLF